ncbi:hypothetical protein DL89DRAFT_258520 [Linderina pennispora]|uniref:BRCT domain-containing protein n=1 Tax=Linderina pennispora TaxID=61395 RepID=A0A1Y1W5J3_9FUNG|nr:uncharacterized protein DL89DRAFT_258520 [Linderina pennispora]ORX68672.1 hypothetical protein DL89DRAFT_258520 [Linderina pennispora]
MPDHLKLTGSSPLSSMGHLEFPMVVQSGWLRACWKAKQRDSMAAARQESADTVPVPVSNRSDSQVMAESAKHAASSRRSRQRTGNSNITATIVYKRLGSLPGRQMAVETGEYEGTESMVGRPIGAAWEESDPFMVDKSGAQLSHENLLDTSTDLLFRRKRQRTLQHQDPLQHSGHGYAFGGRQETSSYMSSPLNFDLQSLHHLSPEPNPTHVAAHSLPLVARAPSRPVETAAPRVNNDSASDKAGLADLFAHCKFTSLGFSANDVATLERVVNEHGGSYINLLSCLPEPLISQQGTKALKSEASLRSALGALACFADGEDVAKIYVVVHLSGLPEVHLCESVCENYPFMDVVTECWIEQCLQESVRYPGFNELANRQGAYTGLSKGQYVLFRPVRDHVIEDAGAMQLSISGYEGIERDHIGKLASVLKIPFSERFTRQTTHLICHSPFKGPKYDRAIRWGIPVVESSWLYDIALRSSLDGGRARGVVPDKSSSTAKALVDMEVDHQTRTAADQKMMPPPAPVVRKTVQSPAATILTTPNSIGKSKALLKTPLSNISQREVSNGTPGVTPMDVSLERNMQQAIDRLSKGAGAAHITPTRASGTLMPFDLQTLGDPGDGDRSLNHILDGVVIALTTRLYHRRNELTGIATELGCRMLPRFDPTTTTHLVHQSTRENETLRDYKTATQHGINVVSPWWLYACRDMRERVREREYPYIYQPERRLRLVAISPEKTVPPASAPMSKPNNTSGTSSRASSRASSKAGRLAEPVPAAAGMLAGSNAGQRNSRAHDQTSQNTAAVGTVLPRHAETGAASTPRVPIPPTGTNTASIGNLFGEKVARTRRRYRRAAGDPADSASGMSHVAGDGEKSASGAKRVAEPPSSEGADAQSLLRDGQATRSSSLHDAAGPVPVSSSEVGSKWWRNTGQQSVSPYGTGFPTDLYSQDFQFGGPGGVDRRISMGDVETGGSKRWHAYQTAGQHI